MATLSKITNVQAAKELVREKADLFQIISEDIGDRQWKNEGSNTRVCCSPFRDENVPSFKVSEKKFKDWGGEQHSGDVFAWIQLWHGMRFEEAIEYAAQRCGIDISMYLRDPTPEELLQARYKQANQVAAEFMHKCLRENVLVRDDYLSRSGFTLDQIEPYMVGYCPSKDVLISHVASQLRLSEDDIYKLEFNRADLFDDAIIYPVHNHSGEIIYFRTRQLNVPDAPYKSCKQEHPLFDLGVLYGFFLAKRDLRRNGAKLVVVEGQRDVIALRAAGVMGSELHDKQLEAIKKYSVKTLIFCYDNDKTGWTKTLDLVNSPKDFGNILVLVARPPDIDTDPHDHWKKYGDGGVYSMLQQAKLPLEYWVEQMYRDLGNSPTRVQQMLTDLRPHLTSVTGIHLETHVKYLSGLLGLSQAALMDYVAEIKASHSKLYNLEAERTLIAACMGRSASLSAAIAAGIAKMAFTFSIYQKLWEGAVVAQRRFGEQYTPQVVVDEAMALFADPAILAKVPAVLDGNYPYTPEAACILVMDMWRRRSASEQAHKLIATTTDLSRPFETIIHDHRRNLIEVTAVTSRQARTPQELSAEVYNVVKERNQRGANQIIGYDWYNMPGLNLLLGGLQPGHQVVIAGSTGAGKSLLGMSILSAIAFAKTPAGHQTRDGAVPTLWVGQEMQSYENIMRLVSMRTGINNTLLQAGRLTHDQALMFQHAVQEIEQSQCYMAKPVTGTIDEILAIIDEYRFKYGIRVVIWDYIQLVLKNMAEQSRVSREELIGHASKIMKHKVAVDMGLCSIVIAQQNRDKEAQGTEAIGGSYQISQDADDMAEIKKKSKKQIAEDGAGKGNRFIKLNKRRGGAGDWGCNAKLDDDPRTATLRIEECMSIAEYSQMYAAATG